MMSAIQTISHKLNSSVNSKVLNFVLVFAFLCIAGLMFYNLDLNPRPWHDEGATMSVARTLVEDGVYAVRNSDGYQTFGPVQSVGPTVILPLAFAFKVFGINITTGRIIAALYSITALLLFFHVGKILFGDRPAIFASLFLLSYPAANFFLFGRQVFGDYPALAFFLGACILYEKGHRQEKKLDFIFAGFLLGAAMVTKSQYAIIGCSTLGIMGLLDIFINHKKNFRNLFLVGISAVGCFAAWMLWQYFYFGPAVFFENSEKIQRLALSTSGFHLHSTQTAVKDLFGLRTGFFYFYWGFPALIYAGVGAWRSRDVSSPKTLLLIFSILWLLYYIFWLIPWAEYIIAASAVTALFVGKVYSDVIAQIIQVIRVFLPGSKSFDDHKDNLQLVTAIMALLPILAYSGYSLQKLAYANIFDQIGTEQIIYQGPRSFQQPFQIASYLNENIDPDALIETWERELFIMTDFRYHFPDQSLLADSHNVTFRGGSKNYSLGKDYFENVRPEYIVIGWFARDNRVYDMEYIASHANLTQSFGNDEWRYELFQMTMESE